MYDYGTDVVLKGRHRQRNAIFPTITMHIDAVCTFVWTDWYEASRSFSPAMVSFEGHIMRMTAIVWSILRSHNP